MQTGWNVKESDDGRSEAVASLRLREGESLREVYSIEVVEPSGRRVEIPLWALSGLVTNTWAIVSFVLAVTGLSPVAVVLAYVARVQIRRRGESGLLLTTLALVVGWVGVAWWALVVVSQGWVLSSLLDALPLVDCPPGRCGR